jgi:hypothetical protein
MKKKILVTEEQLKYIINFIKTDNTIIKEETNPNTISVAKDDINDTKPKTQKNKT